MSITVSKQSVNNVKIGVQQHGSSSIKTSQNNTNNIRVGVQSTSVNQSSVSVGMGPQAANFTANSSNIINDGGVNIDFNPTDKKFHVSSVNTGDVILDGGDF
jgi:hypothetical protein